MTLVLDASVAIAWCFADEMTIPLVALRRRVASDGAVAPTLWPLEVANALLIAIRRGRLTSAACDALLLRLERMDILRDGETGRHASSQTIRLAELHRLTAYDASYLELARRRRLPLATLDAALARAATAEGVATLP